MSVPSPLSLSLALCVCVSVHCVHTQVWSACVGTTKGNERDRKAAPCGRRLRAKFNVCVSQRQPVRQFVSRAVCLCMSICVWACVCVCLVCLCVCSCCAPFDFSFDCPTISVPCPFTMGINYVCPEGLPTHTHWHTHTVAHTHWHAEVP